MRECGVLMPVSSLPSRYGIGTFGKSAYQWIDELKKAGQSYWQILPLGPTSYGDSPYQSFSTYAGNPYFIDLEFLCRDGLLTRGECEACDWGNDPVRVDYEKIYASRFVLLRKAFQRADCKEDAAYLRFVEKNKGWLKDYALFMAVKGCFGQSSWLDWDSGIKCRRPDVVKAYRKQCKEEIQFQQYVQFLFFSQWDALKQYANQNGVRIIGDIPIYVALDSADAWSNSDLFLLDEDRMPTLVAGCPPDYFCKTGQLWGNPLYRWKQHKATGYAWWIARIAHSFRLYDKVRIDHFRGFDEFYAIPYGDQTAAFGHWMKGPGYALFKHVRKALGELPIIAEDLGFLNESVREMLKKSGFPGMKILQFAFDAREPSDYLPHHYTHNCVVYTGTHDNETLRSWFEQLKPEDKNFARRYLNIRTRGGSNWDFIRAAYASVADLAVLPVQDFLELGNEARINEPSTLGGNWQWRMQEGQMTPRLLRKIARLVRLYGRL